MQGAFVLYVQIRVANAFHLLEDESDSYERRSISSVHASRQSLNSNSIRLHAQKKASSATDGLCQN